MKNKFPKMQWKVSKYRRDQRSGTLKPIKRSDYIKLMFEKGTGWNEQKRD